MSLCGILQPGEILDDSMKLRRLARDTVFATLDVVDKVTGRGHPLNPPRRLMNGGTNSVFRSDFNEIGRRLFGIMREVADVRPTDRVLDVGCSVGRLAIEFTDYLTTGTFDGFDVEKPAVEHCQRVITPRHPNFRFTHADVQNSHYTPDSGNRPEAYRFPYPDASFDFVLLTSVFTHMQHAAVEQYLREIGRVLAPGGRMFATFFILTPASEAGIAAGQSVLTFKHRVPEGMANDAANPDNAIAYPHEFVRGAVSSAGLELRSVHPGSWYGQPSVTGYQDAVLAVRPTS